MILHCAQLAVDSGYVGSSLIVDVVEGTWMTVVVDVLAGDIFRFLTERIFSDPELDADVIGVIADEEMAADVLTLVQVVVEIGSSPRSCRGDDVSGIFRAISSGITCKLVCRHLNFH